ncbi:MAG: permease [Pseudomonadota bacterium]
MTELIARLNTSLLPRLTTVWSVLAVLCLTLALAAPNQLPISLWFMAEAVWATLPFILFAVALIAALEATGAAAVLSKAFEGREVRMIVLAALFGGLAPFCSCEVIPFIAALLAVGTPLSAVMAFWLASPLIDPPSLVITAGAIGWHFAIAKTLAAVGIGLMGGFITKWIVATGALSEPLRARKQSGCCSSDPFKDRPLWRFWSEPTRVERFKAAGLHNLVFLLKWLTLAYFLESLLIVYIPAETIAGVVGGDGLSPIVLAAFVGAPAYLNGYAAPPLVAGLMEQGMTAGAAMSFMVAGAVSSIPAMTAVFALVRREVFALYVVLGLTGAIISGVLYSLT